ncbi:ArsR family transcriptional regulator [Paenibacillus sp. GCM10027626]|uniref:ArsR family transcriptional regulator n=1 Tax=Paenibacillus sp. GCM10027626 TaxID=3273411 RepID=UPI00362BA85D
MSADLRSEIEALKLQMSELQQLVLARTGAGGHTFIPVTESVALGHIYYAGQYKAGGQLLHWEPKERQIESLLNMSNEKISKILAALGSKPRLDIITAIMTESLTGAELVEKLQMGTTGQLYHHMKALQGADLITQNKNGRYTLSDHRKLPLLLLLAATADLLDTSDYLDMVDVRNGAGAYLGEASKNGYDANLLLWAVLENCILEHAAGNATEVHIFLHPDGAATVNDNGRGIPVQVFPNSDNGQSNVQTVLTGIERFSHDAPYQAPGAEKGISIAVVNALACSLTVEVQRDGFIYRQDYKHGIPQTGLMTVGVSQASGTGITFKPDPELFHSGFDRNTLQQQLESLRQAYPGMSVYLH